MNTQNHIHRKSLFFAEKKQGSSSPPLLSNAPRTDQPQILLGGESSSILVPPENSSQQEVSPFLISPQSRSLLINHNGVDDSASPGDQLFPLHGELGKLNPTPPGRVLFLKTSNSTDRLKNIQKRLQVAVQGNDPNAHTGEIISKACC